MYDSSAHVHYVPRRSWHLEAVSLGIVATEVGECANGNIRQLKNLFLGSRCVGGQGQAEEAGKENEKPLFALFIQPSIA